MILNTTERYTPPKKTLTERVFSAMPRGLRRKERKMDNKVTKKRISVHFEYDWLKYIAILIVSIFVWYFVFMQINVTRDFEKIEVFFSQYSTEGPDLSTDFINEMNASGDDVIRDVNVNYQSPKSAETYGTLFQANQLTADIMILPKKYMDSFALYFREWAPNPKAFVSDESFANYLFTPDEGENFSFDWKEWFSDENNLYVFNAEGDNAASYSKWNGRVCGIRIDNLKGIAMDNSPFAFDYKKINPEDTESDTEFYLVICSSATNLGKFSKNPKYSGYTHTLRYVRWFLNRYGVEK